MKKLLFFLIPSLALLSFTPKIVATDYSPFWTIQSLFGKVFSDGTPLRTGSVIFLGEKIKTSSTGTAFGYFGAMGIFTNTFPNSELSLLSSANGRRGGRQSTWYVSRGTTDFRIPKMTSTDSFVRVVSTYGVTDIKGTKLTLNVTPRMDAATVGVFQGLVKTSNAGVTRMIPAGKYSNLRKGEPPSEPIVADTKLELKVGEKVDDKWRVFVAGGNTIYRAGENLGASTLTEAGDTLTVANPIGTRLEYKLVQLQL